MSQLRAGWQTLKHLAGWLRHRKLARFAPLVVILVGLGGLLALAAAAPAVSPFVYLLF